MLQQKWEMAFVQTKEAGNDIDNVGRKSWAKAYYMKNDAGFIKNWLNLHRSHFIRRLQQEADLGNTFPTPLRVEILLAGDEKQVADIVLPENNENMNFTSRRVIVDDFISRAVFDPPNFSRRNLLMTIKVSNATTITLSFTGHVVGVQHRFGETSFELVHLDQNNQRVSGKELYDANDTFRKDVRSYRVHTNIDVSDDKNLNTIKEILTTGVLANTFTIYNVQGEIPADSAVETFIGYVQARFIV